MDIINVIFLFLTDPSSLYNIYMNIKILKTRYNDQSLKLIKIKIDNVHDLLKKIFKVEEILLARFKK